MPRRRVNWTKDNPQSFTRSDGARVFMICNHTWLISSDQDQPCPPGDYPTASQAMMAADRLWPLSTPPAAR